MQQQAIKFLLQELDIEEEFVNGDDYETIGGGGGSNDDINDDVTDDGSNYNSGDNYHSVAAASHLRTLDHVGVVGGETKEARKIR